MIICAVTEHILPSNSAEEGLINYYMLQNFHDRNLANRWQNGEAEMFANKIAQVSLLIAQY